MRADSQTAFKNAVRPEELADLRLFAQADFHAIANLLERCTLRALRKGETLLAPGAVNHSLYLLLRGRLCVHLDSIHADPVQMVDVGETVGEISLIDDKPALAYVAADSAAAVLVIGQQTFWQLVHTSHAVARNMLLMVVERMRANNALVTDRLRLREQYRLETTVDTLTGLRNARALDDLL